MANPHWQESYSIKSEQNKLLQFPWTVSTFPKVNNSVTNHHATVPYLAELLKFDNPTAALKRRGAEFTFNPQSMLDLILRIKQQSDEIILAPSFDHAVGDPILDDISILPS